MVHRSNIARVLGKKRPSSVVVVQGDNFHAENITPASDNGVIILDEEECFVVAILEVSGVLSAS